MLCQNYPQVCCGACGARCWVWSHEVRPHRGPGVGSQGPRLEVLLCVARGGYRSEETRTPSGHIPRPSLRGANTGRICLWLAGAHTRNSLHICRQTCSRTGVNLSAASRSDYRREYLHVCLPCRFRQHSKRSRRFKFSQSSHRTKAKLATCTDNSSLSNVNVAALQETSNRVDDVTDR